MKKNEIGAPGWFSWIDIHLLISAQVLISGSCVEAPHWAPHWAWSLLKKKKEEMK